MVIKDGRPSSQSLSLMSSKPETRIGSWGPLYCNDNEEPHYGIGNYSGPCIQPLNGPGLQLRAAAFLWQKCGLLPGPYYLEPGLGFGVSGCYEVRRSSTSMNPKG